MAKEKISRIYLMRALDEGRTTITDSFVDHMFKCLDCRACQTACPSGVQYGKIIEAARAVAEPVTPSEKTVGRAILGSVFTQIWQERVSISRLETLDKEWFQSIGEDDPWAYRRTE